MDLAQVENDSFIDAFAIVGEIQSEATLERSGGVQLLMTASPIPLFNNVLVTGDATTDEVDGAVTVLEGHGLPYSVILRRGLDDAFLPLMRRRGLEIGDATPGMAMYPIAGASDPSGARIEIVTDRDGYEEHVDVMQECFGLSREVADTFLSPELVDHPRVSFAVGRIDGAPVTTAMGFRLGDAVCLFNVATLPDHRKRGLGAAATMAIVTDAAEHGATVAVLQSTEAGFGVYRRLGFETVVEYDMWSPARADSDT